MPRPLSIALIAGLCLAFTARADDKAKPSPVTKRILDKAVAEVKKNRDEFVKANAKPLGEAKKALEDQAKKLIEEGKPDEATAILGQVKTLEADVMKMANAPAGAVPQKPLLERLEGKWDRTNDPHQWHFYLNGTAESRQDEGTLNLRGRIAVISADTFEVAWDNGWKDRCFVSGDVMTILRSFNPQGQREGTAYALERIK